MTEPDVYIFTLLTTTGLAIKWFVWLKVIDPGNPSAAHTATVHLIFIQLVQSAVEYLGYFIPLIYPDNLIYPLIAYYTCLIISLYLIPYIIILTFKLNFSKWFYILYMASYIFAIILLCLTDLIVAGAKYNGITFTRIPGEYYWGFKLLVMASFSFSLTLITYSNFKYINNFISKTKSSNILFCYAGLATFSISLLFIMPHFESINAVGILPILMGIFLFGLAHCVSRENFIDFSYWLPFSKRRRLINCLVKPLITVREDGITIDTENEYDSIVHQHALELFKGDETKALYWLQSYKPPLYSD